MNLSYDRFDNIKMKREPGNHFKLIIDRKHLFYSIDTFIINILTQNVLQIE